MPNGWKMRYGDTDSIMIRHENFENMSMDEIIEKSSKLLDYVNGTFDEFCQQFNVPANEGILEMKFEKVYEKWIQMGSKKNYAGRILWQDGKFLKTPKMEYKGIQIRRSDATPYTVEKMPELINAIFDDTDKAIAWVNAEEQAWEEHSVDIGKIGRYFRLASVHYKSENRPENRSVKKAMEEGIDLDPLRGKFRLYYLTDGTEIAVNFDDELPPKYVAKLDWEKHKQKCLYTKQMKEFIDLVMVTMIEEMEEVV